jgi:hypothetical protein
MEISVHWLSDKCVESVWRHLYTSCQSDVWNVYSDICVPLSPYITPGHSVPMLRMQGTMPPLPYTSLWHSDNLFCNLVVLFHM